MAALALSLVLASCGGGGGSSSGSSDTSSGTPSTSVKAALSSLYDQAPDIASCTPGKLSAAEQRAMIGELNTVRARHGLPAVAHDASSDAMTQASALMGVANNALTHTPSSADLCYSALAATGSANSNLSLRYPDYSLTATPSLKSIAQLLVDQGVTSLGHRRWMLDPFLAQTSFGRVDGVSTRDSQPAISVSMRTIYSGDGGSTTPAALPGFVGYPYGQLPAAYYAAATTMSLTVIVDPTARWNNACGSSATAAINFSDAVVEVSSATGQPIAVQAISSDCTGFGVPNLLSWRTSDLATQTSYTVRVSKVKTQQGYKDYSWTFQFQG